MAENTHRCRPCRLPYLRRKCRGMTADQHQDDAAAVVLFGTVPSSPFCFCIIAQASFGITHSFLVHLFNSLTLGPMRCFCSSLHPNPFVPVLGSVILVVAASISSFTSVRFCLSLSHQYRRVFFIAFQPLFSSHYLPLTHHCCLSLTPSHPPHIISQLHRSGSVATSSTYTHFLFSLLVSLHSYLTATRHICMSALASDPPFTFHSMFSGRRIYFSSIRFPSKPSSLTLFDGPTLFFR